MNHPRCTHTITGNPLSTSPNAYLGALIVQFKTRFLVEFVRFFSGYWAARSLGLVRLWWRCTGGAVFYEVSIVRGRDVVKEDGLAQAGRDESEGNGAEMDGVK